MLALVAAVVLLLASPVFSEEAKPRLDAHGDPLPDGALFRLGSSRFRHGGMPASVVFLDARTLVSNGADGVLRVWEAPSGRQLREIRGTHYSPVPLATDGKILVGVQRDGHFAAWDVRTGQHLRKFGWGYYAKGLGFHRDRLAFANETEISIWDLDNPKALHVLVRDRKDIGGLALSGEGSVLAGSLGSTIRLWDMASGKEIRDLLTPGMVGSWMLAFAPGKPKLLASTGGDHKVRLWDVETGKVVHVFGPKWGSSLTFSADGKLLALGGKWNEDGVALYDVATGKLVRRIPGGPRHQAAQGLSFSPDGKYLAVAGIDCVVQLFEVATGKAMNAPDQPQAGVRDMFLSADGKSLLVGGDGVEVNVWDVTTGKRLGTVPDDKVGLPAGFGKDGRILLGRIGSFEAHFYWHDVVTGKDEKLFRVPQSIYTLALTRNNPTLVVLTTSGGLLSLWDVARAKEIVSLERVQGAEAYSGLALAPDGKRFATAGVVRSVASGERIRTLTPGHSTTVNGVAFSPDGKNVATVSYGEVLIYEAEGDRPPRELKLPDESGHSLAYHPGGKWLAVGEVEGAALHDVATGKVVHRFRGHRGMVRQLAFTPDGKRLITGGTDGTVLVWTLEKVPG